MQSEMAAFIVLNLYFLIIFAVLNNPFKKHITMTTEQKAKAYDEAIKRIKDLTARCKNNRDRRTMIYRVEDIESILPELKDSEGDRIREALIEYVDHGQYYGVSKADMIAWLEKQGEQNTWKPSDEQIKAIQESIEIVGELTPRGKYLKELKEQLQKINYE